MEENVKSFLEKIQEIKDITIPVYLVSSGKKSKSKPLTFKQQKELISTVTDGTVGALKFQKYLNQIVLDNTGEDSLRVVDKLPIILKLRENAIGESVTIDDSIISLVPILEKIDKLEYIQSEMIVGDIQLEVEIPTLKEENKVIQACIDIIKNENPDDLGKSIGNIYTYEIVKYVKNITFGEEVLNFQEIPIKDRVKIIENLPISTNKKIVDFIQKIKETETELLTVDVDGNMKTLELNVMFFNA